MRLFRKLLGWAPTPIVLADCAGQLARERTRHLIAAETLETSALLNDHLPQPDHAKKQLVFALALSNLKKLPPAKIHVERFEEIPLPTTFTPFAPETEIVAVKGYFRYESGDGCDHWHMNFAHHDLFHSYGQFMFAQDEVQVAEHPSLASLRECMLRRSDRLRPLTVENGSPTPILFLSVPRVATIDTRQIYGARFASADDALIRACVKEVEPPSCSNILAIEAPVASGNRVYTRGEIKFAIRTAYSGFRALILASGYANSAVRPIVLHTGNWGCGAYGGNRQLMVSVQIMAARLAGISRVVFHCGANSTASIEEYDRQLQKRFRFRPGGNLSPVVDRLVNAAFPWGTPDGN
ncbi:MAG: hypothetical protein KDB14_10095 [Planctomycetales bacterium]|nr:hypothetical protein [Planctomycetales bacterium]